MTHLPTRFIEREVDPWTRAAIGAYWYMAPCGVWGPRGPWMVPVGKMPTCPICSVERDRILEAGGDPDVPVVAEFDFVRTPDPF